MTWGKSKDRLGSAPSPSPLPSTSEEKSDAYELPISAESTELVMEGSKDDFRKTGKPKVATK